MRDLTKSMMSFTWAMSVFGMRQMANLVSPKTATEAFDAVTRSTEEQLGPATRSMFRAGDALQRTMVETTFRMFMPWMSGGGNGMTGAAEGAARAGADFMRQTARAAGTAAGAATGAAAGAATGAATGAAAGSASGEPGWGPMPGSR
jgi:hypothetical protein